MISIISPMYNEELGIKNSVENMLSKLSKLEDKWEYIVVNDGSIDNSLKIVQDIATSTKNLKIITYSKNRGRGYALRQGFKAAAGDIIITTEADSSWGENIVFEFLDKFKEDETIDMIIASPHLKEGGYKNVPLHRILLSSWGNIILRLSVFGKLTMLSGMCRAYKREVIESLILENDGKEIHLEIASKALAIGYKIVEIPAILEWKKNRQQEVKKRKSSFNAKKLIISHLMFSFTEAPVLLLGTAGLFFIFIGLLIGALFFYQYFTNTLNPQRPLVTLMVILLTVGCQILLFCFLAHQNKRNENNIIKLQSELKRISNSKS